jgi:hypothetical protein
VLDGFTRAEMGARMAELLERSRAQARATPREALSAADAQRTASQAIEFLRLTRVCDWLWTEHLAHQRRDPPAVAPTASQSAPTAASPPPGAPETNGSRPAGARAFAALKRLAEPAYVWGIRNGWRWLVPLKEQVKGRLTRRSAPEAR